MVKKFVIFVVSILVFCNISLAKEIKPGVVITKDNYKDYLPELKKLIPAPIFKIYIEEVKNGLKTIPIVESKKWLARKGFREWTKKLEGRCKIGPDGMLLNWVAGAPFPEPKNGIELAWDVQHTLWYEQTTFDYNYDLYTKSKKFERSIGSNIGVLKFMGRTGNPPMPEINPNPEKIWWKIWTYITSPFDARGFVLIRTRYLDIKRDDDMWAYLPTLRRIRRFTGADVQDPIFGTDMTYDEYAEWGQRRDPKIMDFKLLGVKEILWPAYVDHVGWRKGEYIKDKGGLIQLPWCKRKVYVLEIDIKDPSYMYSKRIIYLDKEIGDFRPFYGEYYDQRGRLWRTYETIHCGSTEKETHTWFDTVLRDLQSGHYTISTLTNQKLDDPNLKPSDFNIRKLIRMGR